MHAIQNRSLLYEKTEPKALPATDLIPRGIYAAKLAEVRPFINAWGERLAFVFEVTEGQYTGSRVIRSTSTTVSRRSRLGQTIAALLGRELNDDEALYGYDPSHLKGTDCRLVLGQAATKAGKPYTTVQNILT